ncbi:glycosyltransferase [Campylobacter geochelonis]|uniref:glycosyltransferase n=1 Tax=Campylobacter geochelonis TaxID=1780362 RepID=UPI00077095B4|nr:glycosyltransferase [Campylobacter geochelonis]CZE47021.1 general glycosylation pathway protein [Campylobacter geochelonis]
MKEKTKLLFVIAALRNGGAERVLQVIANHFAKSYEVSIAILEENENLYKFDKNIKFIYLNIYKSGSKFDKYKKLRECFKAQNPNVIISFIDWTNVACVVANFGLWYKLILTEHNAHDYLKSKIFTIIRNLAYKQASSLTVLTKKDYEYYSKFNQNCVLMYNPFFGKISSNLTQYKKENIILSVARLEDVKGYDGQLEALSMLNPTLLNTWRILIAGDGSRRASLEQKAKNLGLKVEFLGHVENVGELYKKSKIFVLNSSSEGLPNVLIESAFYGCARLSSATFGGLELIKNGVDGVLAPINDTKALANNLEKLMVDDEFRQNLVKNASLNLDKFSPKNIMQKWENLVNSVIKESKQ